MTEPDSAVIYIPDTGQREAGVEASLTRERQVQPGQQYHFHIVTLYRVGDPRCH